MKPASEKEYRTQVFGEFRNAMLALLSKLEDDNAAAVFPDDIGEFIEPTYQPSFLRKEGFKSTLVLLQDNSCAKQLDESREFGELLRVVTSNPILANYFSTGDRSTPPADAHQLRDSLLTNVLILFKHLLHGAGYGRPAEEFVGIVCGQILSGVARRVRRTMLRQVILQDDVIEFDSGARLRRVTPEDIERWELYQLAEFRSREQGRPFSLKEISAVFETYDEPKVAELLTSGLTPQEARFRNVFSLIVGADVRMDWFDHHSQAYRNGEEGSGGVGHTSIPQFGYTYLPVEVNPELREEMLATWKSIQTVESNKKFTLAARRWINALTRDEWDDHLIDYWIALEALFSPSDQGELSFRIALRGTAFAIASESEATKVFSILRKSYRSRSLLVHGQEITIEQDDVLDVRDIVRRSLLKIIQDGTFDPEGIDTRIISGYAKSLGVTGSPEAVEPGAAGE